MNTRTLIAAAALTLTTAGSALAQEATIEPLFDTSASTVTRADVSALAKLVLSHGDLTEIAYINAGSDFRSTLSREEVRRTTQLALASGEVKRINAEAYPFDGKTERRDASYFKVAQLSR